MAASEEEFHLPGSAINISVQSLSSKLKIGSIHRMSLQKKKHLYGGIFFNKVAALTSAIL